VKKITKNKQEGKSSGDRISQHFPCISDEIIEDYPSLKCCGSSDAMSVYQHDTDEGTYYDAYCWSCNQVYDNDMLSKSSIANDLSLDDNGKVSKNIKLSKTSKAEPLSIDEVKNLIRSIGYKGKGYRGIKDEFVKFYGCLTKLDSNGEVEARYYPETENGKITGYTIRKHPKNFKQPRLGKTGMSSDLYGQVRWKKGHGKYVMVCGGQEDCHAALEMFTEYNRSRGQTEYDQFPIVSPTTGEGSAYKQLSAQYDWLDTYDNIYLALDSDKAGKEAIERCLDVLPAEKVHIVTWSGKDPNDMLQKGKHKQFIRNFYNAKPCVSSGIKGSNEIIEELPDFLNTPKLTLPPFMHRLQENMRGGIGFGRIVNIIADSSVGKCLGKDTPVLMADNTIKKVQDIKKGDQVMGDDGSPRNILSVCQGFENLYKIKQQRGMDYVVNESHILSLKPFITKFGFNKNQTVDINIKDYLELSKTKKDSLKGYIADMTELGKGNKVEHPYMVGLWLAEGHSATSRFTFSNKDRELKKWLYDWCSYNNYEITISPSALRETCTTYSVKGGLKVWLKNKNLINNKHIPQEYMVACYEDRVALLSGLLDGDGYLHNGVSYELTLKNNQLAEDALKLARSLGFRVTANVVEKNCQNDFKGEYLRMFLSGDMSKLNLKVGRKIAKDRTSGRDPIRTSIEVESLGKGQYYGFQIDGNKRFCLGDGTVTHNTTLVNSMVYHWIMDCLDIAKTGVVSLESTSAEYALDMLSMHLGINLQAIPEGGEVLQLLDSPEIKDKYEDLFSTEYGVPRFNIVDEREGKITVVEKQIEQMVKQHGCKVIVIDVLSDLLRSLDNSDQEKHMMWQKLMVKRGIIIVNVLHTRKPPADGQGKQRKATEYDAIGSSSFVQSAHINIVFNRDKMAEDPVERNTTIVDMPKCRGGVTGHATDLYYDFKTRELHDLIDYFEGDPTSKKETSSKKKLTKPKKPANIDEDKPPFEPDNVEEDINPFEGEE